MHTPLHESRNAYGSMCIDACIRTCTQTETQECRNAGNADLWKCGDAAMQKCRKCRNSGMQTCMVRTRNCIRAYTHAFQTASPRTPAHVGQPCGHIPACVPSARISPWPNAFMPSHALASTCTHLHALVRICTLTDLHLLALACSRMHILYMRPHPWSRL